MPQSQKQIRNAELVRNMTSDFVTNERYFLDGARLLSAVQASHAAGGGNLIEGWMADSAFSFGLAGVGGHWTGVNISPADYAATQYGGPYAALSTNEYYHIADATWQEAGTEEIFTWRWVYLSSVAVNHTIIAKWLSTSNDRSWRLWFNSGTPAFIFVTNALGTAAGSVSIACTHAVAVDTWYFIAGYWKASTIQKAIVGAATDDDLTITDLVVGVSASVFNGAASLTMGADSNPSTYIDGRIGVGHTRFNVPDTNVDAYARRLFGMTRNIYR